MIAIDKGLTNKFGSFHTLMLLILTALMIAPFILSHSIPDVFLTSPRLWFYTVISITLIIISVKPFFNDNRINDIRITAIDMAIGLILIYIFIRQAFLTNQPFFSDKLISYTALTILYFILKWYVAQLNIVSLRRFITFFTATVIIIAFISCCYGLLQLYKILPSNNDHFKVTGQFYNPARYANYLIALLPFVVSAYLLYPGNSKLYTYIKTTSVVTCVTGLLILPVTNTRSAWIGITVAVCLICYIVFKLSIIKIIRNGWLMAITFILIGGAFFFLYKLKPQSASGRLTIWHVSASMVKDHPLTGVGYGNFEGFYNTYQAAYFSWYPNNKQEILRADVVRYAYNIFLQVLCEQGTIGLLLFILLLYTLQRNALLVNEKEDSYIRFLSVASFSSILAILVSGQASYPFDILPVQIIFFISLGLLAGLKSNINSKSPSPDIFKYTCTPTVITQAFSLFLVGLGLLLFLKTRQEYIAYTAWPAISALDSQSEEFLNVQSVLRNDINFFDFYTNKLLEEKRDTLVIQEITHSRHLLMSPSCYLTLAKAYVSIGDHNKAEAAFKIAADMVPNKFYTKYLWLKFYDQTRQYKKAETLSKNILSMDVKIYSTAIKEIKDNARAILNHAKTQRVTLPSH